MTVGLAFVALGFGLLGSADRGIAVGYCAAIAAVAVMMIDTSVLKSAVASSVLWLLFGLAAAALAQARPAKTTG